MPPPVIEGPEWNEHMMQPIEHVPTRSRSPMSDDGRHENPRVQSTTGSASIASSDDRKDSQSTQGRRSRPSMTASQLQLPSSRQRPSLSGKHEKSRDGDVKTEKDTEHHLSNETSIVWDTIREKPSIASQNSAQEQVVSSRDVSPSAFIFSMLFTKIRSGTEIFQ